MIGLAMFALTFAPMARAQQQHQGPPGTSVTLTLPQARAAALDALDAGNPQLAYGLAKGLVSANPRDPDAYFIIAQALDKMNDPRLGRRAAGYAFRYSRRPRARFIAAQMAARFSYRAGQYTRAQYWLRRSYDYAPDARTRGQTARDFRRIAAENPLSFRLTFSLAPSSNVNSGTEELYLTVDGHPWGGGTISASGQALSGVIASGALDASYRLRQGARSETRLKLRYSTRLVFLSSKARARLDASPLTAGIENADFASATIELGLAHRFSLGARDGTDARGADLAEVGISIGQYRYGGAPYYNYARLSLERGLALTRARNLRFGAVLEQRDYLHSRFPASSAELRADYAQKLGNGARLGLGLVLGRTLSDGANRTNSRVNVYLSYQPAQRIGPARLSLTLGAGGSHHPSYRVGFSAFNRDDRSIFGAVTFEFDKLGFAGFSPTLTVGARRTNSNISRFDTQEISMSIGIRSNF